MNTEGSTEESTSGKPYPLLLPAFLPPPAPVPPSEAISSGWIHAVPQMEESSPVWASKQLAGREVEGELALRAFEEGARWKARSLDHRPSGQNSSFDLTLQSNRIAARKVAKVQKDHII